jgi:hypothetical protein
VAVGWTAPLTWSPKQCGRLIDAEPSPRRRAEKACVLPEPNVCSRRGVQRLLLAMAGCPSSAGSELICLSARCLRKAAFDDICPQIRRSPFGQSYSSRFAPSAELYRAPRSRRSAQRPSIRASPMSSSPTSQLLAAARGARPGYAYLGGFRAHLNRAGVSPANALDLYH